MFNILSKVIQKPIRDLSNYPGTSEVYVFRTYISSDMPPRYIEGNSTIRGKRTYNKFAMMKYLPKFTATVLGKKKKKMTLNPWNITWTNLTRYVGIHIQSEYQDGPKTRSFKAEVPLSIIGFRDGKFFVTFYRARNSSCLTV